MGGDATTGFQDIAGDGEFVGRCANISKRIMQDEVLEMHEFTIDPQRRMRVEEMRPLQKALTDGRAGNALVEPGERDGYLGDRPQQAMDGQFGEIVRH